MGNNSLGSSSSEKSLGIIVDYKLSMRQCHAVAKMANIIMECINGNII